MKQNDVREIINKVNPLAPGERASTYEIVSRIPDGRDKVLAIMDDMEEADGLKKII